MKNDISIKVENISKVYAGNSVVLKDVSFTILKGETVGIIGRNGAGKSTLLKILAGALKPSSGSAELTGSVASILDIGAGFHPDLSGLDNIYLSGSLLGFTKKQVAEKVDEIIAFSELKEYIHQPVKIYSSGMFLRLAFSVFALLDTDILLLDEVLSVGDAAFKRKSFNMMNEFKRQGKTILLVSHNFQEIEAYCNRVIYLDKEIKHDSYHPRESIMHYLHDYPADPKIIDPTWKSRNEKNIGSSINVGQDDFFDGIQDELFQLTGINLTSEGEAKKIFYHDEEIRVHLNYRKKTNEGALVLALKIFDMNDMLLFCDSECFRKDFNYKSQPAGEYELVMIIPGSMLNTGQYYVTLMAGEGTKKVMNGTWHNIIGFEVKQNDWMKKEPWSGIPAPFMPKFEWVHIKQALPVIF